MAITYPSLYNCAMFGAAAGMSSQRQALLENESTTPVAPADSAPLLTTCAAYATEIDALIIGALSGSAPTVVTNMVSAPGVTQLPSTAVLADASACLPAVMGLMSKGAFDRRGIPTDASGASYTTADWLASNIPNAVACYFLAFANNVFAEANATVAYLPLANVAMGAAMAGMITDRQDLYTAAGTVLTPASFPTHVATAKAFATQVDATLQAASPSANVKNMVDFAGGEPWSTVPPTSPALENALYSLTPAMGAICKAIFDGRGIPKDASGVAFVQADYVALAASVAAQFLEYAANVQLT
jgi:hypothetical protein